MAEDDRGGAAESDGWGRNVVHAASFEQDLAAAVRALAAAPDPPHTLEHLVALTPEFFPAADFAAVSLVTPTGVETPAATSAALRELDEEQYRMDEGPCWLAIREEETVVADDLATDRRWPRWGARMADELGIHSSLSLRLFTHGEHTWGALNVYARRRGAFTAEDALRGQPLAAMAAVVLARSIQEQQLAEALETRALIGQATGIVMERFGLDPEAAFNVLRRVSSHRNQKLRDVASQLVDTGRIPRGRDARA